MCGINGNLRRVPNATAVDREAASPTRDAMAHRGPDGEGLWVSPEGTVVLGHRRLAIIDLSETGAQPVAYDSGPPPGGGLGSRQIAPSVLEGFGVLLRA
jgi:asparagine synthase (glutamine-hydrolysing)